MQTLPWIVGVVGALALLTLAAVIFARRSGLLAAAIERQLMELRSQRAAEHLEDLQRERETAGYLEERFNHRAEETRMRFNEIAAGLEQTLREISLQVTALTVLANSISVEVRSQTANLADAVEIIAKAQLQSSPIDSARLETKTEEEVLALAESVAVLRPLVPYPKWRYDADWNNPDFAFRLRQRLWQYFNDRRREAPFITPWHHGTRVCIYLGNDQSRQILVAGCLDPNELAFLDRFLRPGMSVLDIGANDGLYAVLASKCVGPQGTVWAFEPSRREVVRLQRNLELNDLTVRVFPLALADCGGAAELKVAGYGHEGVNTLGAFVHDIELGSHETVQLNRLDDLLQQNPLTRLDFIKLDVEGAELRVLRGAAATLQRFRPVVLFEVSDPALRQQGSSAEELGGFLRAQDYDLYLFDPYSGLPAKAPEGTGSDNMIAVPAGSSLPEPVYSPWPQSRT